MDGGVTYRYRNKRGQGKTAPSDTARREALDTDDRLGVYCEVATDCISTLSRTKAVLPSNPLNDSRR
jgi:hypothetical protein